MPSSGIIMQSNLRQSSLAHVPVDWCYTNRGGSSLSACVAGQKMSRESFARVLDDEKTRRFDRFKGLAGARELRETINMLMRIRVNMTAMPPIERLVTTAL